MSDIFGKVDATMGQAGATPKRDSDVSKWLEEIGEAKKREKDYREDAQRCVDIYEASRKVEETGKPAYNILYANTETLAPAVYNSTPRPIVQRRFKDDAPNAKLMSKVMQRTLEFLVDANDKEYTAYDDLQKSAVVQGLVPGRGCTRFKYHPTITKAEPTAEELAADPKAEPKEQVDAETVCGSVVPWNRIYFGYAIEWADTPWLAFEHFFAREECISNFGEEKGAGIKLTAIPKDSGDREDKLPPNADGVKFAHIFEVWDKTKREVLFISEGYDTAIKKEADPFELDGFFPIPKPLIFLPKISSLVPQPLYMMYEEQAKELDIVTKRISVITKALKIRGFYDSTMQDLETLLEKPDNTLLPAKNVAAMQQGQTLDKAIWLMPLQELVAVLQQLYVNRQQVKMVIQEIMGLADIMRGSSQASETLGAQKIKESWGTLRLKRFQKEVQRYNRDCLRLMAELSTKFSSDTFAKMTGIQLPTAEQKQQAQMLLQQAQMAQQMQPQPAPGQPPQAPPQQPAIDPNQLAAAQKTLATPTWDDVIAMLRDELTRNYSIDIETNSTIDAEASDDKEQVAEFMNAFGQMMSGLQPLVMEGFMPFSAAKAMMLAVVRRFRFGDIVEDELQAMQAPQNAGSPNPKMAAEQKKMEQELMHNQQLHALQMQMQQDQLELSQAKTAAEKAHLQMNLDLTRAKFQATMAKLSSEVKIAGVKVDVAQEVGAARVREANAPKPAPAGKK
jgi:hypothetical protein